MTTDQIIQIAQIIVFVIGFGVLGTVIHGLKQRLNTQAKQLKEQNNMFEVVRKYFEFINPEDLIKTADGIVALKEEHMKEKTKR